jgi:hypothetical protein
MKIKSIFDFINCLTIDKVPWESLSESDMKAFSIFMVNKWLSMNMDYIGIVNFLQQFNLVGMDKREAYNLYLDLLPKKKVYLKYVSKNKDDHIKEYNSKLIDFISFQENWSKFETEENIELLNVTLEYQIFLKLILEYLNMYGISDNDAFSNFGLTPF